MAAKSNRGGRHYTPEERNFFLDILMSYKDNIEGKKSDASSLKDKESAWQKVATHYNSVRQITQERTVGQLKKLWSNLKQTQRNALTKERQSRLATGGGPEEDTPETIPEVAIIAPHLMTQAPTLFSCNLLDQEIDERFEIIVQEDSKRAALHSDYEKEGKEDQEDMQEGEQNATQEGDETTNNVEVVLPPKFASTPKHNSVGATKIIGEPAVNKFVKRSKITSSNEMNLREERLRAATEQEAQMTQLKMRQEEELHRLKIKNEKEIHALERRYHEARAKLAEAQYQQFIRNTKM